MRLYRNACMEIRVLLGLSANKEAYYSILVFLVVIYTYGVCCDEELLRIVKGGHILVGLTTSNSWLVLSSFVHCMSVVPVAMYCQIEWCISQPQLALAF